MAEEKKEKANAIKKEAAKTEKVKEEKKAAEKHEKKSAKEKAMPAEVWNILEHSLLTEKSISLVESQNKLVFIVRRNSNKNSIKWAIEKAFEVKVDEVKTLIDQKGRKKAFVKLDKNFNAGEIATRLGML